MCKYFPAGTGGDFFILNWMEVIGKRRRHLIVEVKNKKKERK